MFLGIPCTEFCTCKACANDVCLSNAPIHEDDDDEVEEGDAYDGEKNFETD